MLSHSIRYAVLPLALVLALAAWGDRPGGAPVGAPGLPGIARAAPDVLGTMEATVDGESRTWYVVSGEAQDGPYASGVWMESEERRTLVVGGLDAEDPPIETFSRGGAATTASLGDYEGSALTVLVELPEGGSGRYAVSEGSGATVQVVYMPDAGRMDPASMYHMVEGVVEIEAAEVADGHASARGTFSGTLEPLRGGEGIPVTEGRFEVRSLPNVEEIQPG